MSDKLSMSLDDIIKSSKENKIQQKAGFKGKEGNAKKFQKTGNKNFHQKAHVVKSSPGSHRGEHDDRIGGKFNNKSTPERNDRPLKVITIERPKVIPAPSVDNNHNSHQGNLIKALSQAQQQSSSSSSSVFQRLGKPGTTVIFSNLKKSVLQQDVYELCRAIGDVKEVQLSAAAGGVNTAKVLFSNERDALASVAKYHGVPLDGFEMHVVIENAPQASSVFDRFDVNPLLAAGTAGANNNIRSGLFGTALPTSGPLSSNIFQKQSQQQDEEEDEDEFEDDEEEEEDGGRRITLSNGTRKVTIGANRIGNRGRGGGRGVNRGRGGGGRGRGNGRRNNNNNTRRHVNEGELDNELDEYMADR